MSNDSYRGRDGRLGSHFCNVHGLAHNGPMCELCLTASRALAEEREADTRRRVSAAQRPVCLEIPLRSGMPSRDEHVGATRYALRLERVIVELQWALVRCADMKGDDGLQRRCRSALATAKGVLDEIPGYVLREYGQASAPSPAATEES